MSPCSIVRAAPAAVVARPSASFRAIKKGSAARPTLASARAVLPGAALAKRATIAVKTRAASKDFDLHRVAPSATPTDEPALVVADAEATASSSNEAATAIGKKVLTAALLVGATSAAFSPAPALAAAAKVVVPVINQADTAWILISTGARVVRAPASPVPEPPKGPRKVARQKKKPKTSRVQVFPFDFDFD